MHCLTKSKHEKLGDSVGVEEPEAQEGILKAVGSGGIFPATTKGFRLASISSLFYLWLYSDSKINRKKRIMQIK